MSDNREKIGSMKNSVDMDIFGDNISDIAEFTVEKYEFRNNCTLSSQDARGSSRQDTGRPVEAQLRN